MYQLFVPATVRPEHSGNYLETLGALLRAQYGGNVVATHEGVFYDNAACDCPDRPEDERRLYEFMVAAV